jgi:site-specific DNA-methyltransferase (adenine-specific)
MKPRIDQRDRQIVTQAFHQVRDEWPPDRVVADPELNARFLRECTRLGATQAASVLNQCLLNVRKASQLPSLQSKRTSFPDQQDYVFASEIAIRFLERRDGITLDDVICDPVRATEFEGLAVRIAPGYTALQYRWAALSLRKNRRLQPEPIGRAIQPTSVVQKRADEVALVEVPTTQGLYIFFAGQECLYIGEAQNLRSRLKKHLDHSNNRGLARWLWEHGADAVYVEWQVLPSATSTRVRRAMECELIRSRRPLFNFVYSQNRPRKTGGGVAS